MFPGFVNIYRDENEFIHLFFFSGIDDFGNDIYRNIDLSRIEFEYTRDDRSDGSIDYVFQKKGITQITYKLVPYDNTKFNIEQKTIKLK